MQTFFIRHLVPFVYEDAITLKIPQMKKYILSIILACCSVAAVNAQETDIDDYDFHTESRVKSKGNWFPNIQGLKLKFGSALNNDDYSVFSNQLNESYSIESSHMTRGVGFELWLMKGLGFEYGSSKLKETTYSSLTENLTITSNWNTFGLHKTLFYKKKFLSSIAVAYVNRNTSYFLSNANPVNPLDIFSGNYNSTKVSESRSDIAVSLSLNYTIIGKRLEGFTLFLKPSYVLPIGDSEFNSLGSNLLGVQSNQNLYLTVDFGLSIGLLKKRRSGRGIRF